MQGLKSGEGDNSATLQNELTDLKSKLQEKEQQISMYDATIADLVSVTMYFRGSVCNTEQVLNFMLELYNTFSLVNILFAVVLVGEGKLIL